MLPVNVVPTFDHYYLGFFQTIDDFLKINFSAAFIQNALCIRCHYSWTSHTLEMRLFLLDFSKNILEFFSYRYFLDPKEKQINKLTSDRICKIKPANITDKSSVSKTEDVFSLIA